MPDEPTEGQAGTGAPDSEGQPQFDPASAEIEVAGRKMTVADLTKSYTEAEKTLRQAQQEAYGYRSKLDGYSWADDLQTRYQNDPAFRQAIDEAVEGSGGNVQQLNPQYRELQELKMEQARLRMEREFDKIRSEGDELTKEMEQKILHEIAVNPAVQDVRAAYRNLFWEQKMDRIRAEATAQVSEQMTDNREAYSQKPSGSSKKAAPPSVSDMSPEQRDEFLMQRIKELDMFK